MKNFFPETPAETFADVISGYRLVRPRSVFPFRSLIFFSNLFEFFKDFFLFSFFFFLLGPEVEIFFSGKKLIVWTKDRKQMRVEIDVTDWEM